VSKSLPILNSPNAIQMPSAIYSPGQIRWKATPLPFPNPGNSLSLWAASTALASGQKCWRWTRAVVKCSARREPICERRGRIVWPFAMEMGAGSGWQSSEDVRWGMGECWHKILICFQGMATGHWAIGSCSKFCRPVHGFGGRMTKCWPTWRNR
jgi:hypothetical protein